MNVVNVPFETANEIRAPKLETRKEQHLKHKTEIALMAANPSAE
jgi:hypothetical protein